MNEKFSFELSTTVFRAFQKITEVTLICFPPPVSMDDDSDSDDSDEDEEEDFEPKPIPIQPPQMKAAALINGIKAGINGPI